MDKLKNIKKNGMTLVEMLVALAIFMLGVGGFTMLASKSWKMNAFILESGNATSKANRALSETIKSLRKIRQADDGSYLVKTVSSNDLVVYVNDDGDALTERVHYYLDSTTQTFKKGVTKPSGNPAVYPTGDQVITVVTSYVTNTSLQPVFEYYNSDYPIDMVNNPLVNPIPADVKLVKICLWVNVKPLTAPDNVKMESFVEFRNLNEVN